MFIRKKGECYALVENHRVHGKVRQKIIASLGRSATIEERIAELMHSLARYQRWSAETELREPNRRKSWSIAKKLGADGDEYSWKMH
jgi:hypothetical protein